MRGFVRYCTDPLDFCYHSQINVRQSTRRSDMPRPRLHVPAPQLSHGQAAYVLERLISDRRISPGEVSRYVSDMHREISDLESRLQTLRSHVSGSAGTGSGGGTGSGAT